MDAQGITFSLHTVISLVIGVGGMMTTYHLMNSKIQLMAQHNKQQDDGISVIHKRIDDLKAESVKNVDNLTQKYEGISESINTLKLEVQHNKTEIINEIHKMRN